MINIINETLKKIKSICDRDSNTNPITRELVLIAHKADKRINILNIHLLCALRALNKIASSSKNPTLISFCRRQIEGADRLDLLSKNKC
jgi:hypothetical protein